MKVRQFGHVAFRCSDLDASLFFYREQLGFKEKFRLTYGDYIEAVRRSAESAGRPADQAFIDRLEAKKDKIWIIYLDVGGGSFIELFDKEDATRLNPPKNENFNYLHFALEVEDIHALREELTGKGVLIDRGPTLGVEGTWQMWTHDPDGNQIEWMQYTEKSMQLIGRYERRNTNDPSYRTVQNQGRIQERDSAAGEEFLYDGGKGRRAFEP